MRSFHPHRPPIVWIVLALACLGAGALIGALLDPPSEDSATVAVFAVDPGQLQDARLPELAAPPLAGVSFRENPDAGIGGAIIKTTRANEALALSAVREAATDCVGSRTPRQDRWLRRASSQGGGPGVRAARRSVLDESARYELRYNLPSTGAGGASAALRGALIGLLASGIAAALMAVPRRRGTVPRSAAGGDPASAPAFSLPSAWIAGGVLGSAGLVALSSVAPPGAYTFVFAALLF